jgi:hypothetical protein
VDDEEEDGGQFATTTGYDDVLFDRATLREAFNEVRCLSHAYPLVLKKTPSIPHFNFATFAVTHLRSCQAVAVRAEKLWFWHSHSRPRGGSNDHHARV